MHIRKTKSPTYITEYGMTVLRDRARDILVPATPEEFVRQRVVRTLLSDYGYPLNLIRTELVVVRGQKSKPRADIVVYGKAANGGDGKTPLIVIECKRPEQAITAETLVQGQGYCRHLGARYLVLTNGTDTECFEIARSKATPIVNIPLLSQSVRDAGWVAKIKKQETFSRPSFNQLKRLASAGLDAIAARCRDLSIGIDTPQEFYLPITNLYSLLLTDEPLFSRRFKAEGGLVFLEDLGSKYHEYTNAGGGRWSGWYRSFLIEGPKGIHLVRLSLAGIRKTIGDSHWGTRRGGTNLIVAVSDREFTHHSLQLRVDDYCEFDTVEKRVVVTHSGRMGGKGSFPAAEVRRVIAENTKWKIDGEKIILGSFPSDRLVEWEDAKKLVVNLCIYGLLRDKARLELTEARRLVASGQA